MFSFFLLIVISELHAGARLYTLNKVIIILLIIIIIIIVTIKITHINFHLRSRLLLPYISVINVEAKRLKAKLAAESN